MAGGFHRRQSTKHRVSNNKCWASNRRRGFEALVEIRSLMVRMAAITCANKYNTVSVMASINCPTLHFTLAGPQCVSEIRCEGFNSLLPLQACRQTASSVKLSARNGTGNNYGEQHNARHCTQCMFSLNIHNRQSMMICVHSANQFNTSATNNNNNDVTANI